MAQLSHPGIIQAYDSETDDAGRHFLVMEFVAGTSLDKLLREQGKVTPPLAADYVYQAAQAMQHAHARGLIHRDLKPSNLLLTPDGRIKVLDLGLARFLQDQIRDPAQTREGTGMGTPDYAAPEQFRDAHNVDQRADIYSLGCTLYHLLAGRVPFPGSSLSEKYEAHQKREPTPLQELCPEAPAGLVLTMQKMMAKKPADRFPSAAELAEALSPYVANSSPSFAKIQTSSQWNVSTLTFHGVRPRRRLAPWLIAGLSLVAVLIMGAIVLSGWLPSNGPTTGPVASNLENGEPPEKDPSPAMQPDVKSVVIEDPNVLTVSKDAKDGGQYRTINEALDKVKAGQTVRVLDDATYSEAIALQRRDRFEGVTLEAPRRATLHFPAPAKVGIVVGVPHVTVRGFRIQTNRPGTFCMAVLGPCPGARLEELEFLCDQPVASGLALEGMAVPEGDDPVVIENCTASGCEVGIQVFGLDLNSKLALLCRGVIIRNNRIHAGIYGIWLAGQVKDVQVVGNRVWDCGTVAFRLTDLFDGSGHLLLANNTFKGTGHCLQIGDLGKNLGRVEIRNNLLLTEGSADVVFIGKDRGPLDGLLIDHNWRQVRPPAADSPEAKTWIRTEGDRIQEKMDVLSGDPSSPGFLRPAGDSPLATQGAGVTDPSLAVLRGRPAAAGCRAVGLEPHLACPAAGQADNCLEGRQGRRRPSHLASRPRRRDTVDHHSGPRRRDLRWAVGTDRSR